jgi:regulatory protein
VTSRERAMDPEARLQDALDAAYRYLSHRERTVQEVRRQLERRRVEPATIDAAIEALIESGYLDDAGYARRFAEDRRNLDAWGADRIARKLLAVGVAEEYVEAAVAAQDGDTELAAAIAVLERRLRVPPADDRDRNRALGLLVRRGYDLELAHTAIRAFEQSSSRAA